MFSFNNTNKLCKSCHCNPCCCQTTCVTRRDVVKINWKQLSFTNDDQSAYVVRTSDTSFDISANVSPDAGNALIKKPNGLYVDDSQFSFLVSVGDTQSVNLSGTGILGDPILADIIISPNAGNALTSLANGLFVATPASISYDDTQTIDLSFAANILTANARISGTAGNILTSDAGGLYVPTDFIQSIADTNSIDLAVSGLGLLTANTKISASAGNIATINPDGIYVPSPSSPFISSIDDTDTINLSVVAGELTADAIISTDPGNILINNNGLYIAQAGNNGLSLNISSGNLVLGQDIAELGDPAQLLSSREIPISTYDIRLTGTTGKLLTPRFRTGNNFSLAANRNNSYPFVVLTNQDDPSSTDAAYGGGSIDIRTGYNLVAPPGGADAIQVGLTISGQINSSNTQNWGAVGDLHPKWMNMAAVLVAVNGASGNIHKSAGFYSSFKNDSPTLSFEEVNLIDLTYDHTNPTTVNHANGIRIADYDMGNNGCGIFMVLGDSIAPPSGRWDIYSQTGYNSYLNGSLQIGSDTSLGSEKLQVTGSAVITNSLETRNSSDNNLLNSQGIGKTLIGGSTPLTGITTMLQVFGTTSFNQPVAIGGQFDPLYPLNITMGGSASAIHIGGYSGGSDIGGYITSSTDASLWLSGGASFNGTVWRAKATTASTTKHETGLIQFFTNSGLTVGNTFTPTERARINTSGNLLVGTTTDNGNRFRVSGNSDISGTLTVSTLATGTTSDFMLVNTTGLVKQVDPATYIANFTPVPTLQEVTDEGNTTTNDISIGNILSMVDGSTTLTITLTDTNDIVFDNNQSVPYFFNQDVIGATFFSAPIFTASTHIQSPLLKGGSGSGNNLTLSSTSNATKGKILFGTSAYDEANNRLGIGTNSPSNKLDVIGATGNFSVTNDGRVYGSAIHNNAGAVTGTTNQYIASGTYTPSITNGTNVSASTARQCQWIRVGNVVTVSGSVNTTVTSTGAKSTINISLPISSTFSSISNLAGSYMNQVTGTAIQSLGSSIYADTTNNDAKADFNIQSTMTNPNEQFFTFTYIIL